MYIVQALSYKLYCVHIVCTLCLCTSVLLASTEPSAASLQGFLETGARVRVCDSRGDLSLLSSHQCFYWGDEDVGKASAGWTGRRIEGCSFLLKDHKRVSVATDHRWSRGVECKEASWTIMASPQGEWSWPSMKHWKGGGRAAGTKGPWGPGSGHVARAEPAGAFEGVRPQGLRRGASQGPTVFLGCPQGKTPWMVLSHLKAEWVWFPPSVIQAHLKSEDLLLLICRGDTSDYSVFRVEVSRDVKPDNLWGGQAAGEGLCCVPKCGCSGRGTVSPGSNSIA